MIPPLVPGQEGSDAPRESVLATLRALAVESEEDREGAHRSADRALLALIGDPEVTAAFEAVRKWYS